MPTLKVYKILPGFIKKKNQLLMKELLNIIFDMKITALHAFCQCVLCIIQQFIYSLMEVIFLEQ